jgi:nucleoside-diphosphate-sugar epimerase
MRILLIGGNGFIGSPLTRELLEAGHEPAILHRGGDRAVQHANVRYIHADRNNLSACGSQVREFAPDVIIDLILSSGEQARQLMEFARGITPRVVALSSQDVYRAWGVLKRIEPGELEPLPLTEKSPLRSTRHLYAPEALRALQGIFGWVNEAYDKIAVEQFIMSTPHVAGTVLRLPMIYGVGDRLNRFFPLVKRIADGRRVILLADDFAAWRAPRGYVDNVAHAIALAALDDRAGGRIYNICEEPCLPELEWQKRIARQINWSGEFVVLPVSRTPAHLRFPENAAQHIVVSSDPIRKELGYREIVDLDEGIRRTVAWEQAHPPAALDPQQFDYAAEDQARAGAA